jgi:hypothetical protein
LPCPWRDAEAGDSARRDAALDQVARKATRINIRASFWSIPQCRQNLVIGVRSDIRYELSQDAVIADENGKVVISAFQDNVAVLKV